MLLYKFMIGGDYLQEIFNIVQREIFFVVVVYFFFDFVVGKFQLIGVDYYFFVIQLQCIFMFGMLSGMFVVFYGVCSLFYFVQQSKIVFYFFVELVVDCFVIY